MTTRVLMRTDENNVDHLLEMEVYHHYGYYNFSVRQIEDKHDGFISCILFKDGNFVTKIAEGRKSQKKLDKYNNYIQDIKNTLFDMYNKKEYRGMALLVQKAV